MEIESISFRTLLSARHIGRDRPARPNSLITNTPCKPRDTQADGSGLYSAQGLWTQAREKLNVLTIVCANRTYAILKLELAKQRIAPR